MTEETTVTFVADTAALQAEIAGVQETLDALENDYAALEKQYDQEIIDHNETAMARNDAERALIEICDTYGVTTNELDHLGVGVTDRVKIAGTIRLARERLEAGKARDKEVRQAKAAVETKLEVAALEKLNAGEVAAFDAANSAEDEMG